MKGIIMSQGNSMVIGAPYFFPELGKGVIELKQNQ
jgi:hypothetical protein